MSGSGITSSRALRLAALAAALAVGGRPVPLAAQVTGEGRNDALPQESGSVRGRVVESGSGRSLGGVQIIVLGTRIGAVTNDAGEYRIPNVPAGTQTLRARRIGYSAATQTVSVAAGATVDAADISLAVAATELDRVVVTGTPQATSQRTVGNAVTTLDVEDLTDKSSLSNVTDVLQSKSPGVTLIPGSGTPGTAADIRIRGTSSLSATNRPIIYIDGVRMNDASNGNYGPSGAGTGGVFSQGTSALDAINPNDIESVQIIKGPAASTLYGADAAGGVIQIVTKKGARGTQSVRWAAKAEAGSNEWALPTLTNYTTCTQTRIDARETSGPATGEPTWPGCQGKSAGTVISGNPLRDDPLALRAGAYRGYNLSARGGGERYTFYVSGDENDEQGVFDNSYNNRRGGRANFGFTLSDRFDFQVNTGYIQTHTRLPLGDDAGGGIIISAVRGQPGSRTNGGRGWRLNVPEIANAYDNQNNSERTILGGTVNYHPVTWFRNRFTAGIDFNSPIASVYYAPFTAFSAGDYPSGFIAQRSRQTHLYTFDYAGVVSNTLPRELTSEFSLGVQGVLNQLRRTEATGTGLPSADFKLIQSAQTVSGSSDFSEQASLGYFAQEQLGYANRLFLTGALRIDDNSAFGEKFNRVVYPKASLSYVVSEEPVLVDLFRRARADNLKLRLAYGQAGRAPGPYDARRTYTSIRVVQGNGSIASGLTSSAPGNENLEAERGTEYEYGADASFLDNRLGIEFTGYRKTTSDALLSIGNAPSLGFTANRYVNFGRIRNSGIELALRGTPVRSRVVTWDAQVNYATNQNKLERLNFAGITQLIPYNPYAPTAYPTQILREGFPVAGFFGVDVKRLPNGSYDTTSTGQLQFTDLQYVGPATPKYEGSVGNTVTLFKNVRLYALIDFKGGHFLFNQKDRNRDQSANRNSRRFNDPSHPLSRLDSLYWSGSATRPWIQRADFVKLRDVSISYLLPSRLTRALRTDNATLTVAGHNLGFISKKYPGIDPEVNFFGQGTFYTGTSNFIQFVRTDAYTLPMLRRITTSLNVSF